jgi:hypothetical protein
MRYMMLINHRENFRMEDVPQALFAAMDTFVSESQKKGVLIDTAGLQRSDKAVRVQLRDKKISVTDGPFSEAKEVVGGYAIIEATSKQEATDLAKAFMELHRVNWPAFEGFCEVRALETGDPG